MEASHAPELQPSFRQAIDTLRKEVEASLCWEDYTHWKKLRRWGQATTAFGYSTAWIAPNPISAAAIALGNTVKWSVVAHHVSHKGFDAIPNVPAQHTSKGFAKGARRYVDWLDWIYPEAWNLEHNVLHHFYTGEPTDPDLVEENTSAIRQAKVPRALKYAAVGFYALTWKYTYYAPNTFQVLERARKHRQQRECERDANAKSAASTIAGNEDTAPKIDDREASAASTSGDSFNSYKHIFDPRTESGKEFWRKCLLPYGLTRFVALPLAYAPLGPWAMFSVWSNSVMAECITNAHTFLIVGPNHSGDDLYRFDEPKNRQQDFYARQVMGSVNYNTGGDLRDFLHGFLNYQIEHHLFPALPPRAYQRVQPKVKAICEAYGVPYVQESVFKRFRKLANIMVGKTSMKKG
jgi:fatty acid desaturase